MSEQGDEVKGPDGCESCASAEACKCEAGRHTCRVGGECGCDPALCPCAGTDSDTVNRRGCLPIFKWPLSGPVWIVLIAGAVVVALGGGLFCSQLRNSSTSDSGGQVAPAPSESPTKTPSPFGTFGTGFVDGNNCTKVEVTQRGEPLEGSKIDCIALLKGNLDAGGAQRWSQAVGAPVDPGTYFVVAGRVDGPAQQIGLGWKLPDAPVNQGNPDAVAPIGLGGYSVAIFGNESGWHQWKILDAGARFAPTGRSVWGRIDGGRFYVLVPARELPTPEAKAELMVEAFVRKTLDGQKPSPNDPTGASGVIISSPSVDPDPAHPGFFVQPIVTTQPR